MPQQRRRYRLMLGILSLGLLAGVALTASPAPADTGPGPFLAEPAWSRKLPAATRFLVLTGGTNPLTNWNSAAVLDKETGLVWETSPQTTGARWNGARLACATKTVGNRQGWRLPSIPELASLIDPNVTTGLRLPPGHPFTNIQSAGYWSAMAGADLPAHAWYVGFGDGNVDTLFKAFSFHVWCVRGGNNAEAY
jgi:hypothetical protein